MINVNLLHKKQSTPFKGKGKNTEKELSFKRTKSPSFWVSKRRPVKRCGNLMGSMTASFNASLAASNLNCIYL